MANEEQGMLVEIGVTEKRYLQELARIEARTMKAAQRAENNWKQANGRVSKSFQSVDQSANRAAGGGMRNVSLQLSQVAQQASATGDPLRALAIQLPDMTLGFGTLGIALGVVAGALLPLAADFLGAGDNAEAFDKTIEGLSKAVKRHEEAVMNAARPYSDLREEFGESAGQARELYDALAALERLDVISGLNQRQKEIASRFGVLDQFKPEDYINAGKALASLQERLQELRDGAEPISVDEGQRIQEDINKMGELASAVQRVQVELGLTAEKAGEFAAAVSAFQTADPASEAQKDALREVRSILVDAVAESGKLTEEQRAFAVQIVESERELLTFLANLEDAEAGTAATADQARLLADEISRAAQAALDFVSNLGSASLAGLRAEVAALEAGGSKGDAAVARREAEVRSSPEFQAAMQGPVGLQQEALARLQRELELTREEVALRARRTEVLREETKAKGGSASASEKLTATERLAKQVIERATEAAVRYGDVVEVLRQKLESGEISQSTFNKAIDLAKDRVSGLGSGASAAADAFTQLFDGIASGG